MLVVVVIDMHTYKTKNAFKQKIIIKHFQYYLLKERLVLVRFFYILILLPFLL